MVASTEPRENATVIYPYPHDLCVRYVAVGTISHNVRYMILGSHIYRFRTL